MNNEKILYYLGILENGALNYYQTVETIRIASQSIQDYIEQLQQQNKKYKEVIDKIFNYLEDNYGYSCVKGIINDTDVSKLYDILKEVE